MSGDYRLSTTPLSAGSFLVSVGAAVLWPLPAVAEVMDKEPTLPVLFGWTAIFLLAALLLARLNAWVPLLVLPFSGIYATGTASELFDPHVGPAILAEGGWAYMGPALLAVTVNLLAPVAIALCSFLAPGVRPSLRRPSPR